MQQIYNNINTITIGGFDGIHLGHQELFKHLGTNGAIIVIQTGYANLTPNTYRNLYTHYPIIYYDLKQIRNLSGKDFLELLSQQFPNLKTIIVGFDFHFGKDAKYNTSDLEQLFYGTVKIVPEFFYNNIAVHSKTIREYISAGDILLANQLLGKPYTIHGEHIKGQGIGAKELLPTINIQCKQFLLPKDGVYYTYTTVDRKKYLSVTFLGHRRTTDQNYAIETHIIDKNITVQNPNISIEFHKFIRGNKKFTTLMQLQEQILYDIQNVKREDKDGI